MALNPVAYTVNVVKSFLRYQLTAYPFAGPRLHGQMRTLLSLDETRRSPLLKGPYISLSRPFREGASVASLVAEGVFHPLLRERIPPRTARSSRWPRRMPWPQRMPAKRTLTFPSPHVRLAASTTT